MRTFITVLAVSLLVFCSGSALAQNSGVKKVLRNHKNRISSLESTVSDLEGKTTLGDLSCTTDQIARFDGSEWACATDNGGIGFELIDDSGNGGVVGKVISITRADEVSVTAAVDVPGGRSVLMEFRGGEIRERDFPLMFDAADCFDGTGNIFITRAGGYPNAFHSFILFRSSTGQLVPYVATATETQDFQGSFLSSGGSDCISSNFMRRGVPAEQLTDGDGDPIEDIRDIIIEPIVLVPTNN